MNELTKLIIEDGQPQRAIEQFLNETFEQLKGKVIEPHKFLINEKEHFNSFLQIYITNFED
jgi:hypothetical protein